MRGGMGEVVSGGSNERRKWARAEEVGIRPRVEAIHLSGGGGIPCRAETEEGGGRAGVEGRRRAEEVSMAEATDGRGMSSGPRAEAISGGSNAGGGDRQARDEEAISG